MVYFCVAEHYEDHRYIRERQSQSIKGSGVVHPFELPSKLVPSRNYLDESRVVRKLRLISLRFLLLSAVLVLIWSEQNTGLTSNSRSLNTSLTVLSLRGKYWNRFNELKKLGYIDVVLPPFIIRDYGVLQNRLTKMT